MTIDCANVTGKRLIFIEFCIHVHGLRRVEIIIRFQIDLSFSQINTILDILNPVSSEFCKMVYRKNCLPHTQSPKQQRGNNNAWEDEYTVCLTLNGLS